MYCEGSEDGVRDWVAVVHVCRRRKRCRSLLTKLLKSLRYKDYQLVSRPAHIVLDTETAAAVEPISEQRGRLVIVSSVKDFGTQMQARRVLAWWRRAMGYSAM